MISILTAIACSDYDLINLDAKEDITTPVVSQDTGMEDPPVVDTEDTDVEEPPQDTGDTPDPDTTDTTDYDTIPTTKEYLLDMCANHVTPNHCPVYSDFSDITECRSTIVYDSVALDALKTSAAGLTIFATMDTTPSAASDISIAYLHLSEGDNRDAVMAEFGDEDSSDSYAGRMSMHRFVDVPHVDCFSHDTPLNRNRIDLDPSLEMAANDEIYNEARLHWSNTSGDYNWAYVGGTTYDAVADDFVRGIEFYGTAAGYIIYGTELLVDDNNGDLMSLVKSLTADNGAVPETYSTVSRWTKVYYVP